MRRSMLSRILAFGLVITLLLAAPVQALAQVGDESDSYAEVLASDSNTEGETDLQAQAFAETDTVAEETLVPSGTQEAAETEDALQQDSEDDPETENGAETEDVTEVETEVETEVATEVETEEETKVETEVETETEIETETEVDTETEVETETETETEEIEVLVPGDTSANEQIVFDYLVGEIGLNQAAACGVMANIKNESDFNPTLYGDHGTSFGITQWHASRFDDLKNYCKAKGLDYTTLDGQLTYFKYELNTDYYRYILNYLKAAPNTPDGAYACGHYFCVEYERPADKLTKGVQRGTLAEEYYWPIYGRLTLSGAENTQKGIKVTWNPFSGVDGYDIQRKAGNGKYKLVATLGPDATSYQDTDVKDRTLYSYRIRSFVGTDAEPYSEAVSVTRVLAPEGLKAATCKGGIRLTWNAVSDAEAFNIYRLNADGKWTSIDKIDGKETGYSDMKLSGSGYYSYKISVVVNQSESAKTSTKATAHYNQLANVTDLTGTVDGIKVTWAKVEEAQSYIIYHKAEGGKWLKIGTAEGTSFLDNKVKDTVSYIYAVKAVVDGVKRRYIPSEPYMWLSPVQDTKATQAGYGHLVSWKAHPAADGYRVYRRKAGKTTWSRIATITKGTTLSYKDTKANDGVKYEYVVKACKGTSTSGYYKPTTSYLTRLKFVKFRATDTLNYRSGPGKSYPVKGMLDKGEIISVVSGARQTADGYTWYRFIYGGKYYYAASAYLKKK